jgi:lactam utilization protein B
MALEHSDFSVMDRTVRLAKDHGVFVGAHPSYPDRQGFGRREMIMDPVRLLSSIAELTATPIEG